MNQLTNRIVEAIDSTDLKDAEIARQAGVSRTAVYQWRAGLIKGIRAETATNLEKVTGYSAVWITTGRGEKFASGELSDAILNVPALSMTCKSQEPEAINTIRINKEWVIRKFHPMPQDQNLRFIHASGDSMMPTFSDGDILLVDIGNKTIETDRIYVIEANETLFIKRVSLGISGNITISSDNAKIKLAETLDSKQEITVHGKVIYAWTGKTL